MEREAGIVEEKHCNVSLKPDDMQKTCNTHMCPAKSVDELIHFESV